MNVDELLPTISSRIQFSLRYRKSAPNTPGCYVLTTFDGNVLYVGLTNNLYRRFSQHRDVKEKCEPTPQGIAFWFYYLSAAEKEIHRITWMVKSVPSGARRIPHSQQGKLAC